MDDLSESSIHSSSERHMSDEPKKFVHTAQNYNKSMENNGEKPASLEVR